MTLGTSNFTIMSIIVALFIASAGLWWFSTVIGSIKTKPAPMRSPTTRYGIYAAIWIAYFVLVLIIIQQTYGAL